jgi:hypothetical protein
MLSRVSCAGRATGSRLRLADRRYNLRVLHSRPAGILSALAANLVVAGFTLLVASPGFAWWICESGFLVCFLWAWVYRCRHSRTIVLLNLYGDAIFQSGSRCIELCESCGASVYGQSLGCWECKRRPCQCRKVGRL